MLSRKLLKGKTHNVKLPGVTSENCWALQYVFIRGCMNTLLPWDMPSETLTWMQTYLSLLWGTLFSFKTYQEMGSCSLLYNSLMAWTLVQETGNVGSFPCSVRGERCKPASSPSPGNVLPPSYKLGCGRQHSPTLLLKLSHSLLIKKFGDGKKTPAYLPETCLSPDLSIYIKESLDQTHKET